MSEKENELFKTDILGRKRYLMKVKNDNGTDLINVNLTVDEWKRVIKGTQEIKELKINQPNYYLGDSKYVLYQIIDDINAENYTFICGKYAFDKISKMNGFTNKKELVNYANYGRLNLNGEIINVCKMERDVIDKKDLIVVPKLLFDVYEEITQEINNPNNMILKFA